MSTAAQTRATGFYWVRQPHGWEPAYWDREAAGKGWWEILGDTDRYNDVVFAEIDERPIQRQPEMPVYKETQG